MTADDQMPPIEHVGEPGASIVTGGRYIAIQTDEQGRIIWQCFHIHRSRRAALQCAKRGIRGYY